SHPFGLRFNNTEISRSTLNIHRRRPISRGSPPSLTRFPYGIIVSPQTRQTLRTTPSFPGGSLTTWSEIHGGQSSPEITEGRCFAGCWSNSANVCAISAYNPY